MSDEHTRVFVEQKNQEITALYDYLIEQEKIDLRGYGEESAVSLNTQVPDYELYPYLSIRHWQEAIAEKTSVHADKLFLRKQLLNYIENKTLRYSVRHGKDNNYLAFKKFLEYLPDETTYEWDFDDDESDHDLKRAAWSVRVIDHAQRKLEKNYGSLVKAQSFHYGDSYQFIVDSKKWLGGDIISNDESIFPTTGSLIINQDTFQSYYERLKSLEITVNDDGERHPFYNGLYVPTRKGKIALVLTYLHDVFGVSVANEFWENYIEVSGYKAYSAANKIYPVLLGVYAAGDEMAYTPDIYLALSTREFYRNDRQSIADQSRDAILLEQSGLDLVHKRYRYHYRHDSQALAEAKKQSLNALSSMSESVFSRLLNTLFNFEMLFGFFNIFSSIFETAFEDFVDVFGEEEIANIELEEEEIVETIAVNDESVCYP